MSIYYNMKKSGASRRETICDPFGSVLKFDLTPWFGNVDNLTKFPIAYKYLAFSIDPDTAFLTTHAAAYMLETGDSEI